MIGVGVDGCPSGWFVVAYDGETFESELVERFADVVDRNADADHLLVDMPIGLPESGRRACDEAARSLLGPRASTVFFTPCRAVLDAADHETASSVNRARTGHGLSIQAWHLVPRIREVDTMLRQDADARRVVHESHPELCFRALAGEPIAESKKTDSGRTRRLDLLADVAPAGQAAYETALETYDRRDVARDDIVDALVLAISASLSLTRVPEEPRTDRYGLPMEITFPSP